MATFAIGDIQGCYKTLKRLLKRVQFNERTDRIFLVGDLVNRGPNSLDVLRWAKDLGPQCVSVLGNHDLYLLSLAWGATKSRNDKFFKPILRAKDCDILLEWLQKRPVLYKEGRMLLVHAGILPGWTADEAMGHAREIEKQLNSKKAKDLLRFWHETTLDTWSNDFEGYARQACALNAFTRMRMVRDLNSMDFTFSGKPEDGPKDLAPWFVMPGRKNADHMIVFGHWAALGLRVTSNTIALDSGCVWGNTLSAIRLEDGAIFAEQSVM